MSMVGIHLPQPLFVLSIQCVTERFRPRVLHHCTDNTYNFGVFVSVWQTAILLSVGLSEKGKAGCENAIHLGYLARVNPSGPMKQRKTIIVTAPINRNVTI